VELKLEDLADFDYIQKFEKKKAPNAVPGTIGGISAADAQKFIRQDRIGFRPIRTGTATGGSSGGNGSTLYPAGSTGSLGAVDVVPTTAEASTSTIEGQGDVTGTSTSGGNVAVTRSASNIADMEISGDDGDDPLAVVTPSNITGESNVSNVDMSLDESL